MTLRMHAFVSKTRSPHLVIRLLKMIQSMPLSTWLLPTTRFC